MIVLDRERKRERESLRERVMTDECGNVGMWERGERDWRKVGEGIVIGRSGDEGASNEGPWFQGPFLPNPHAIKLLHETSSHYLSHAVFKKIERY